MFRETDSQFHKVFEVTGFCNVKMNTRLAFLKENEDSEKSVNSIIQMLGQDLSGIALSCFSVTSGTAENDNRTTFQSHHKSSRSVILNIYQHVPRIVLVMPLGKVYSFTKLVLK